MVHREARSREGGAIAVIAAIVLVVVGAFLTLSLNIGHQVRARTQLQAALDSAALAGARELIGTTAALAGAHTKAQSFAAVHVIDKAAVAVRRNGSNAAGGDVVVGYWDLAGKRFYSDGQNVTINGTNVTLSQAGTPQFYNAVKVVGGADGVSGHNPALDVYFGGFLSGGPTKMMTSSTAIAVGGGACSETGCSLPFAVPSCALQDAGGALACGTVMTFNFSHGKGKDIAFANIAEPSKTPNPPTMIDQNTNAQTCSNPSVSVGDDVKVQNGDDFNGKVEDSLYGPTLNMVCTSPAPYADCPRRVISVLDISDCGAPMTGSKTIVGFIEVVLLSTVSNPGNARAITMYLDCTRTSSAGAGCVSFGYTGKVRLVQ